MASATETLINNVINGRGKSVERATAVAAALELIAARVSNSSNAVQLQNEMENLADYADKIEAALTVK